jgi:flagellar P-ring protein FlgI
MMKLFILFFLFVSAAYSSPTRLKDLVTVKGVRDNPLIGYGLVIGLNGTGDAGGEITNMSLKKMFQKLGLNPQNEIASKNVAAVIVTGQLSSFSRVGQKIDITVSSIAEASSIAGGTLLVTPMKGGDGEIYAIASGPLSIGGLKNGAKFATTGSIPSGAIIEKELSSDFHLKKSLRLTLNQPDFTTAARIEKVINSELGGKFAISKDNTTIDLVVPEQYQRNVVHLMAILENFEVNPDQKARIVINEKTGTVVAGGEVTLKPVAISHGNLSIEIGDKKAAKDKGGAEKFIYIEKRTNLNDLVKALNAIGATPEDLISIFQALKRNGSLIGEIELI